MGIIPESCYIEIKFGLKIIVLVILKYPFINVFTYDFWSHIWGKCIVDTMKNATFYFWQKKRSELFGSNQIFNLNEIECYIFLIEGN